MDVLGFVALVVTGFASCTEFGSYAFVHPVVRQLPQEHHVRVEQGLLKTFGRVMPVLMTLCVVLSVSYALQTHEPGGGNGGAARLARGAAAASFVAALVFTIAVNVPINAATKHWNTDQPPADWKQKRNRWEFFQGVRSWLLLIGFVLLCLAVTLS